MPVCAPGICRIWGRERRARKRSPAGLSGKSAPTRNGMQASLFPIDQNSHGIEIDIITGAHAFEASLIQRYVENFPLLCGREATPEIGAEFFDQERNPFCAPASVTNGIFDQLFRQHRSVGKAYRN